MKDDRQIWIIPILEFGLKCSFSIKNIQVVLLSKLVLNKENVRELVVADVLPHLVDLTVLAHLHVQRATIQNQVCFFSI